MIPQEPTVGRTRYSPRVLHWLTYGKCQCAVYRVVGNICDVDKSFRKLGYWLYMFQATQSELKQLIAELPLRRKVMRSSIKAA
jgi:hypothetical protein